MRRLFLSGWFVCISLMVAAQADSISRVVRSIQMDTLWIDGATIDQFAIGLATLTIQIDQQNGLLNDLLAEVPSIYFKSYGNQQLSTIAFRGTSASHTNVLWHGIPINPPTLGQMDFATWPAWLMESLTAVPGGSGALFGSGAIGGSILIDESTDSFNNELSIKLAQGSFGHWFTGLKGSYRLGSISGKTSVYQSAVQNDFMVKPDGLTQAIQQTNAAVQSRGLKQSLDLVGKSHRWHTSLLYNENDRQIQPSIFSLGTQSDLLTTNLRMVLSHRFEHEKYQSQSTVSRSHDETLYNHTDKTTSTQWSLLHRSNLDIGENWIAQGGLLAQYADASSLNLSSDNRQNNIEPFVLLTWYPTPTWSVTFNNRYLFLDGSATSYVPALSTAYDIPLKKGKLGVTAQWSTGYRYPTLNDRFWMPGGNPELTPEQSRQAEIGLNYTLQQERSLTKMTLNGYSISSTDWIIWLPGEDNFWTPSNIRGVINHGIEGTFSHDRQLGTLKWKNSLSANCTWAIVSDDVSNDDFGNQKLPYVPAWQSQWHQTLNYKNTELGIRQRFTGSRFTNLSNDDFTALDSFYLLDSQISHVFKLSKTSIAVQLSVNNLLNTYYELQENLAMPGINYELTINYNL
jgi:vitamin B12 transporter